MLPHNLPAQSTPFVGRTDELADLTRLLADPDCRLLTLAGQGGIGKTRLAMQAAQDWVERSSREPANGQTAPTFAGGLYFVSLQPLSSPDHLLSAIAEAVGFQFQPGGEPRQQLLDYVRDKSLLLILDNFEHLLDGAETVSAILTHAPDVKIVVTSRETLNLQEEWLYQVQGMRIPDEGTTGEIEPYSAVRLFMQSAQRARPDFTLESERDAVIRICRLVEGLPLALEMTAAWLKRLACPEIAAELEHGLDILETPTRNAPPRHRSMRVVFDHSWTLLTGPEREVFKQLSVFRGGFRKEAAQSVAGASLATLSALVDKSLVRADDAGRYDLHDLLRQYGEEQLNFAPEESERTHDRHAAYYAGFMQRRADDIKGRRQLAALNEIEADFENLRGAWLWALRCQDYAALDTAAESLFLYCEIRGRFLEGKELLLLAQTQIPADLSDETRLIRARIVPHAIWLWSLQSDVTDQREALKAQIEDSIAVCRQAGDFTSVGFSLWLLAAYAHFTQQNQQAIALMKQSLALLTEHGERFYAARSADWLGAVYGTEGYRSECVRLSEESLEMRRAIGDQFGAAASLLNLVGVGLNSGQYAEALHYIEEMGSIYRRIGSRVWAARESAFLAITSLMLGDFARARTLAEAVLEIVTSVGARASQGGALALSVLGLLAVMDDDYATCFRLCESAFHGYGPHEPLAENGLTIALCGLGDYPGAWPHLREALKTDLTHQHYLGLCLVLPFAALLLEADGQTARAAEVLELATHHPASGKAWLDRLSILTRLRERLHARLGDEGYAAARKRGQSLNVETTAKRLIDPPDAAGYEPRAASSPPTRGLIDPLSTRELEVLRLITEGLSNDEIAEQLVVGVSTVKKHINHIFAKLSVRSRMQAVVRAQDMKLI